VEVVPTVHWQTQTSIYSRPFAVRGFFASLRPLRLFRKNGLSVREDFVFIGLEVWVRTFEVPNKILGAIVWLRAGPSRYCSPRAPVPCCAPP